MTAVDDERLSEDEVDPNQSDSESVQEGQQQDEHREEAEGDRPDENTHHLTHHNPTENNCSVHSTCNVDVTQKLLNDRSPPPPQDEIPTVGYSFKQTVENGSIPGGNGIKDLLLLEKGSHMERVPMEKMQVEGKDDTEEDEGQVSCQALITLNVLLLANLLNYIDRYTIAGVLLDIQDYYGINDSKAGLLQTSFICSYMILSPIFGYLGDRYNRKLIMACGIAFWSIVTLAGSFVPSEYFGVFLFLRGMVGVGEASYSTIAPTIIADLFVKDRRTKALTVFYFAIPVGSGLGYIVGSNVAQALGAWQWALRVTPALGILCVILIITVVKEPPRGASEGGTHLSNTSWFADCWYLCKNKSFIFSSLGFTCVAFVAGALSLWAPAFMDYSIRVQGNAMQESTVALIFGGITCFAGFSGVAIGTLAASQLRKTNGRADPLICAFGLIACAPFLYAALALSSFSTMTTWVMILIGEILLCLNWALVADIVLYVVIPTRRSTAEAFQILLSHALGDAGSPSFVGVISDGVRNGLDPRKIVVARFTSLQYSLYSTCYVAAIGGAFFLICALFIQEDRAKADKIVKGAIAANNEFQRVPSSDDDFEASSPSADYPGKAINS